MGETLEGWDSGGSEEGVCGATIWVRTCWDLGHFGKSVLFSGQVSVSLSVKCHGDSKRGLRQRPQTGNQQVVPGCVLCGQYCGFVRHEFIADI